MRRGFRSIAPVFIGGLDQQQRLINDTCLFFASDSLNILNKVSAEHLPNQVTGSSDFLTVTGTGLNARYRTPDNATYRTADSDYVFWKSDASESVCDGNRLVGYDFPRIIIKYLNVAPYTIIWIAILKPGITLSSEEINSFHSAFHLPVYWSGIWNDNGYMKQNRPLSQRYVWTAESTIPSALTDANLKGFYDVTDLTKISKNGSDVISQWRCLYGVGPNINLNTGTPHWRASGVYGNPATNDFMRSDAFTLSRNQPEIIYAIFRILASTPSTRLWDSNFTDRAALLESATIAGDLAIYANGAVLSPYVNASIGSWHVIVALYNGTASKIKIDDGADIGIGSNIGIGGGGNLALFGRGNGTYLSNVEFNTVCIRNGTDAVNETDIYNWLKARKNTL